MGILENIKGNTKRLWAEQKAKHAAISAQRAHYEGVRKAAYEKAYARSMTKKQIALGRSQAKAAVYGPKSSGLGGGGFNLDFGFGTPQRRVRGKRRRSRGYDTMTDMTGL